MMKVKLYETESLAALGQIMWLLLSRFCNGALSQMLMGIFISLVGI